MYNCLPSVDNTGLSNGSGPKGRGFESRHFDRKPRKNKASGVFLMFRKVHYCFSIMYTTMYTTMYIYNVQAKKYPGISPGALSYLNHCSLSGSSSSSGSSSPYFFFADEFQLLNVCFVYPMSKSYRMSLMSSIVSSSSSA